MYLRVVLIATILACSAAPPVTAQDVTRVAMTDEHGRILYWFLLNERQIKSLNADEELPARPMMDPENAKDFRGWHKPKVRKMVRQIEKRYGIEAQSMTSYIAPTFSAYVGEEVIRAMRTDPDIDQVNPVPAERLQFSAWSDIDTGTEIISWGKTAVGTNDTATFGDRVIYLIDARAATHQDLNLEYSPVNALYNHPDPERAHATHVAGILGAAINNSATRGVAPGIRIKNVSVGNRSVPAFQAAMDWVLGDAERSGTSGIFAVANLSLNMMDFCYLSLDPWVRRLSSRVLVVQSAGNIGDPNATTAYCHPSPYDGILVVGGVDENGAEATSFDNRHAPPFSLESSGSSYGPNVEVWAPAQRIWSSWNTSSTAKQYLSGTSMAAPHVAALAARYGNIYTTPVQREQYVRARLFFTGYYDRSALPGQTTGLPIYMPSEAQPLAFTPPAKLVVQSVTADSTSPGTDPNKLVDGYYLNEDDWNSGHYAPSWVQFDLGWPRTVSSIRLTPESFTTGNFRYKIYAGNSPYPGALVATIDSANNNIVANGNNLATVSASLGNVAARYVLVSIEQAPDWVSFREVELYGY